MKKLIASESQEAQALIKWARLKKLPLIHITNEAKLERKSYIDKKTGKTRWYCPGGKKLNAMGREKGFPDFFLFVPTEQYHGLAIELKRKDFKMPKSYSNQYYWLVKLRVNGYEGRFAFGWEHAKEIIENYLAQS